VTKRAVVLILGVVALGMAVACAESLDELEPAVGVTTVAVRDDYYEPRVIEVPAGTEVTWVWEGRRGHDVVSNLFRTSVVSRGDFVHTFDEPGVWDYICTLHAGMTGRVIVTD
jgi:plastocyanin